MRTSASWNFTDRKFTNQVLTLGSHDSLLLLHSTFRPPSIHDELIFAGHSRRCRGPRIGSVSCRCGYALMSTITPRLHELIPDSGCPVYKSDTLLCLRTPAWGMQHVALCFGSCPPGCAEFGSTKGLTARHVPNPHANMAATTSHGDRAWRSAQTMEDSNGYVIQLNVMSSSASRRGNA